MEIIPDIRMDELQKKFLGARRTLFRHYHIGGCSSCGFSPEETLAEVCLRNEGLDVNEAIRILLEGLEEEKALLISAVQLQELRQGNQVTCLVDVRSKDEHEAVNIFGSVHFDQNLMQEWMAGRDKTGLFVFYDHMGKTVLDAASYFVGHGFQQVKCLEGGIDAWAAQVDPTMPRYVLE
jgi:rhodanese-related sulfurtransferase